MPILTIRPGGEQKISRRYKDALSKTNSGDSIEFLELCFLPEV
jgi:hypothetical protein